MRGHRRPTNQEEGGRYSRRGFLQSSTLALSAAALARPTTLLAQATGAAAPIYDLVIKGGEVIDPSQNLRGRRDVAIRYARLAALEPEIPGEQATYVLPADGKLVLPAWSTCTSTSTPRARRSVCRPTSWCR